MAMQMLSCLGRPQGHNITHASDDFMSPEGDDDDEHEAQDQDPAYWPGM